MKKSKKKEEKKIDKLTIKLLYKQIRSGCKRKNCYNIYCNNNLICNKSKKNYYHIFS